MQTNPLQLSEAAGACAGLRVWVGAGGRAVLRGVMGCGRACVLPGDVFTPTTPPSSTVAEARAAIRNGAAAAAPWVRLGLSESQKAAGMAYDKAGRIVDGAGSVLAEAGSDAARLAQEGKAAAAQGAGACAACVAGGVGAGAGALVSVRRRHARGPSADRRKCDAQHRHHAPRPPRPAQTLPRSRRAPRSPPARRT